MTLALQPWEAGIGWLDLLADRSEGGGRFSATPTGLMVAIAALLAVLVLIVLGDSVLTGAASAPQIGGSMLIEALPVIGLWAAIWGSAQVLRPAVPLIALLVPATYAMAFTTLAGLPLALYVGAQAANLMVGALGFMLYREARLIAGFGVGVSIAFTVICIVLLVAVPIGFYMLSA